MRVKTIFPLLICALFLSASCSSLQAGLYLSFIDANDGDSILKNETRVKALMEDIIASPGEYAFKSFARTGVSFQFKRTKLLTHKFYVIGDAEGGYHTLSFYGTKMAFYSRGAWALDADSDMSSYNGYLAGDNKWDVRELFERETIDARETAKNIILNIDGGNTYYYKDHITKKPGVNNCNTAMDETIVLKTFYAIIGE